MHMFCKAEVNLPIMGYWSCLLVIYVGIGAGVRQKKKNEHQGGVCQRNILIEN